MIFLLCVKEMAKKKAAREAEVEASGGGEVCWENWNLLSSQVIVEVIDNKLLY